MNQTLFAATWDEPREQPLLRAGPYCFDKLGPTSRREAEWFAEKYGGPRKPWLEQARECRSSIKRFRRQLAMDTRTLALLLRLLEGFANREFVVVEGPPGTTKTAAVKYAAALIGLKMVRVSFCKTKEANDTVGGFRPAEGSGDWRWFDGPVVAAMSRGWLLYLDEVNLARPAETDRLLPVLERDPEIVLDERDGRRIEGHPLFRVVASINAATVSGRGPLSTPLSDRAIRYFTTSPETASYEAIARHWLEGRAGPSVEIEGQRFALSPVRSDDRALPDLGGVRGIDRMIPLLARFQYSLAGRAEDRSLGRDRREAYSFGLRSFEFFLSSLNASAGRLIRQRPQDPEFKTTFARVLHNHFVESVEPTDRDAVCDLIGSLGLLDDKHRLLLESDEAVEVAAVEVDLDDIVPGTPVRYQDHAYTVGTACGSYMKLRLGPRGPVLLNRSRVSALLRPDGVVELREVKPA